MDKIDIHNSEERYKLALKLLETDLGKDNSELIKDYLDANSIGKTARKGRSRRQAGTRGLMKSLYVLKLSANYFKKNLKEITVPEMENYIRDMNSNKLIKHNGKPYAESTKSLTKKILIAFLRYHIGEGENFSKLTDWIETAEKKKETPALSEKEVEKMLEYCNNLQQSFMVGILFDCGCRIEEFLNIRLEDVTEVTGDVPYYRVILRQEFSKTKGRTVSLLWKHSHNLMKRWIEHRGEIKQEEPLFPLNYDNTRITLTRIGKRALNKRVYPHLMRHSSATYYASKRFTYAQLCKRYGWSIGSSVPQRYIDMSGIEEERAVKEFKQENIEGFKDELAKLTNALKIEKDKNNDLDEMKGQVKMLLKALAKSKREEIEKGRKK
jgi:integrase